MQSYIIRRVLLFIPTLILVTLIIFSLVRFVPGSVVEFMVLEHGADQEKGTESEINAQVIRHMLGLDVPIYIQYGRWIGVLPYVDDEGNRSFEGLLQGNLGKSMWRSSSVLEEIGTRLPVTIELGLMGLIISQLIAIPIGVYSAIRQDTAGDYTGRSLAILLVAIPAFWIGTLVIVYPSVWWDWSPPMQLIPFTQNPLGNLRMFILPAAILGLELSGVTMRMTRTMMLEVLRQDYIRTAWAKGLKERAVIARHGLKNALIPVVTFIGLYLPIIVGGTVVIEQLFNLPGMGRLLIQAINQRDYTIVSGVNLVVATFVMFSVLITDLTYAFLDPRIRYE
jgi:peptide/nickel transport system permease protein